METIDANFTTRVTTLVTQIPLGRVMSYGQIATLCGNPRAARVVGGVAHFGDDTVPWHRVVNKYGGLAAGYPGGKRGHMAALQHEGVQVDDSTKCVDIERLLWKP